MAVTRIEWTEGSAPIEGETTRIVVEDRVLSQAAASDAAVSATAAQSYANQADVAKVAAQAAVGVLTAPTAAVVDSVLADPTSAASIRQSTTIDGALVADRPRQAQTFAPRGDMFMGLAAALKYSTDSVGVQVVGDSTTTPDTAWFRLVANDIAAQFPAITTHYRKWNDTKQDYDRPVVINTAAGGRRAMVIAADASPTGRVHKGASIIGDLDVAVNMKNPLWVGGGNQIPVAKWISDTDRSWALYLTNTGALRIQWSADGSTWVGDKTSTAVVAFADNTEGWIRVVIDVDNGAAGNNVLFYTSTDGATWTQLGTTLTTAGVTSIAASGSHYGISPRSSSALKGGTRIYEVWIRDGIGGPTVAPVMADNWPGTIGYAPATNEGAPVLTFLMGAKDGEGLGYSWDVVGYLGDPVRQRKMTPHFQQSVILINDQHNEYFSTGDLWATRLKDLTANVGARIPFAGFIMLTQNPSTDGSTDDIMKLARRRITFGWARRNSIDVIDTYKAFIDDGRDLATVLIGDGTHPTSAGYIVWKDKVMSEVNAAVARA